MPWATSDRRTRLPADWPARRTAALRRDHHTCITTGCDAPATDVDHIKPSGSDELANLASLCSAHHKAKTAGEGHAAMRAIRAKAKHPVEQHPGMRRR